MGTEPRKIAVLGLGYVGLPLAVAFARKLSKSAGVYHGPVVGFDINASRVAELNSGNDHTGEVSSEDLKGVLDAKNIIFTADPKALKECDFVIVAVPTPIDDAKIPDLRPLIGASRTVGENLKKGTIVVYESTVYPGCTEEDCVPVLEKHSTLKCGRDFWVGYSPERMNPGDKEHTVETIVKIVSGQTPQVLNVVASVYSQIVKAGVYPAASIKVAEAAKVIENTQRDLNIALMNELSMIFERMGLDTLDVLAAAGTKWNFLPFRPGLVGGHCIGVDPYYLTHKAEKIGYHPQVILAGRRINDGMGAFVVQKTIKSLLDQGADLRGATVTILGFTFKENVPDLRNTRVIDIVKELQSYSLNVQVHDPLADPDEAHEEYGLRLTPKNELQKADAIILAVAHNEYKNGGWCYVSENLKSQKCVVVDLKGILPRESPKDVLLCRL